MARAGAIKSSPINPSIKNRELRDSMVPPVDSTHRRPLNVPFHHAPKGHELN